jgi:hypothetical protein
VLVGQIAPQLLAEPRFGPLTAAKLRCVLPELAGIGATPAARASFAAVAKRCAPAISPTDG